VVYHPSKSRAERLDSRFPYGFGVGKLVRRYREPRLAAAYARSIAGAMRSSVRERSGRRLHETLRTTAGFVVGAAVRAPTLPAPAALRRLPPEIVRRVDVSALRPIAAPYRAPPHLVFATDEAVLHAYVEPHQRLLDSLDARARAIAAGVPGVPAVHAAVPARDVLWLLEERLVGRAGRRAARAATDDVGRWAVRLAATSGEALADSPQWQARAEAMVRFAPEHVRPAVAAAVEQVAGLPSVVVHGDLEAKNVLVGDDGPHIVDWEDARVGVPGEDLLFLAVTSERPPVSAAAVRRAIDPTGPWAGLLEQSGVPDALRADVALVAAAGWALDELHRRHWLGVSRAGQSTYRSLLTDLAA
jgi:hypothetical protein